MIYIPSFFKKRILNRILSNDYIFKEVEKKVLIKQRDYHGMTADLALYKLLDDYQFSTVLDIGSGQGLHSKIFLEHGKKVTSLDFGDSVYFEKCSEKNDVIICDYLKYNFNGVYDCIWASHILEHQLNPNIFLKKIFNDLKLGGVVAITVPPMKSDIVGGHVNLYNAGLLLYHMVLAGFDCKSASIATYGYNVSIIVKKTSLDIDLSAISYDSGDINKLSKYFPDEIIKLIDGRDLFCGDIQRVNW